MHVDMWVIRKLKDVDIYEVLWEVCSTERYRYIES